MRRNFDPTRIKVPIAPATFLPLADDRISMNQILRNRFIRSFLMAAILVCFCPCALCLSAARADEKAVVEAWVKRQIADERLSVTFYDPAKPPKPFPGWTDFEFRLEYNYEYDYDVVRKGKRQSVVISPKFTQIDVPTRNLVQLPNTINPDRWHESPLGQHELEHVRVGVHPRLKLLGRHLVRKITRLEEPGGAAGSTFNVTPEMVANRIDRAITLRRDAIQNLVTRINQKIDKETRHGSAPFPELDQFLERLYLKECLDEYKFEFLPDVLDLIDSREYQRAKLELNDPRPDLKTPEKK